MKEKVFTFSFCVLSFVCLFLTFFIVKGINFYDLKNFVSRTDIKNALPKIFIVRSGSMSPGLPPGSVIAVRPQNQYRQGDVISFTRGNNQYITHRITKVIDNQGMISYETKGDANSGPDREPVASNQVVGAGFYALPYVGYLLSFMKTRTGFSLFVAIPAVLILLSEAISVKNELKRMFSNTKFLTNLKKMSFYLIFLFFLPAISLPFFNFSGALFSDTEKAGVFISTGTWDGVTPTPPVWDKSSLYFVDSFGCKVKKGELQAKVCNGKDSKDMEGTSSWQLFYTKKGNPKGGEIKADGDINALKAGECQVLTYILNDPPDEGIYMFRALQRPGHPGKGELWSDECIVFDCGVCKCSECLDKDFGCEETDYCHF